DRSKQPVTIANQPQPLLESETAMLFPLTPPTSTVWSTEDTGSSGAEEGNDGTGRREREKFVVRRLGFCEARAAADGLEDEAR
ncbi:hypothetical protein A2U01_0086253, partial [Trifolium medium]|nr:hypothetical protein [Trifolium medium]